MTQPSNFGPPPSFAQPAPAPQYAPGVPMPQQPQPAPMQGTPMQAYVPQGQYAQGAQVAQLDIDSVGDEGSRFPKCTYAGGMPWYLTVAGCSEVLSFHDSTMTFWIDATLRQSPDPAFGAGMTVAVGIKKLGDRQMNNKAQARLRDFLAACCNEAKVGQAPGHFAGRKTQALAGQLNGAPFVVSFLEHTTKVRDTLTGEFKKILLPSFQAG